METVKSSDALESQILEDARGKARRILESADRECAAIRAEGDRKRTEEERKLDAGRDARIAALSQELASSLPLDNMRARLAFIQEAVSGALKDLFDSLSARDLARIIGRQLAKAAAPFKDARVVAWHSGISADEARRIIRENMPGVVVEEAKPLPADAARESGKGIVLESTDGSRRYRGTLNELAGLLLEEYREELVTALFGKDVQK